MLTIVLAGREPRVEAAPFPRCEWSLLGRTTRMSGGPSSRSGETLSDLGGVCGDWLGCLEGYGGSSCMSRCRTEACSEVLSCGRGGGGMGCFNHYRGRAPSVCPEFVGDRGADQYDPPSDLALRLADNDYAAISLAFV